MAISIASETTGGTTTGVDGTFSVTKPATVNDGDLLLVIVGKQDDPSIAPPGDWTTGGSGSSSTGNDVYLGYFYKFVTDSGSEPASYTFDSAGASEQVGWWIGSLSGVSTYINDATAVFNNRQNDASPNTSALTSVTPDTLAFAAWAVNNDNDTDPPGGSWDTRADNVGGNGVLTVCSQAIAARNTSTGTPEITNVTATEETEAGIILLRAASSTFIQVTHAGAYLVADREAVQVTHSAAYLVIDTKRIQVSHFGAYLAIEEIPVGGHSYAVLV